MKQRLYRTLTFAAAVCATLSAQMPTEPSKPTGPWMNKSLSPDERAELAIAQMTLDEKIQLVHGTGIPGFGPQTPELQRSNGGGGFVPGIPRLGLPDLNMDDSSMGPGGGARKGRYSTALPSTLALASSWDPQLAVEYGKLIGRELADQGFNVSLGGGVDITREARNGRNFEYQGEDPILAGTMVAQLIQGVQSQGVIGDVKHYALNDSETGRYFSNSVIDKRSMRESDLLAFEIAVKQAKPGMVMCSYNLVNSVYACENDYLLNQVLKRDWGFEGWVVSDWFGTHSTEKAALAGLDQEQPGIQFFDTKLKDAVQSGAVPMDRLNNMVHRILRTEFAIGVIDNPQPTQAPDIFRGFRLAEHVEEQSAVLLKNDGRLLPLDAHAIKTIAVIGGHADAGVLSGGGSAQVDAAGGSAVPHDAKPGDVTALLTSEVWHRSPPLEAIGRAARGAKVSFDPGADISAAAAAARNADVAIVFVTQHTHEAADVPSLELPGNQNELVSAVAAANKRTIVVVESGGPVTMPWAGEAGAILEAWYPGIRGGQAIADLLFGDENPSGKLAVSFPKSDGDLPHPIQPAPPGPRPGPLEGIFGAPKIPFNVKYTEDLKVGYKWYDAEHKEPLFPFGHGLSYTTYTYSAPHVSYQGKLRVEFQLSNTGKVAGAEVAQVYLALPAFTGEPPKRLIGWRKVSLAPGETKTVSMDVDPLYISIFDPKSDHWTIAPGDYGVLIGASSRDLALHAAFTVPK